MAALPARRSRPVVAGLGEVLWDRLPSGRRPGGAPANFAWHAQQLGARGIVVSRVGKDLPGRALLARLRRMDLSTNHVSLDPVRPTGAASVRLSADGAPRFDIRKPAAWDFIPSGAALERLASESAAVCFGSLAQRAPISRRTLRRFLHSTGPGCLRAFDVNLRPPYFTRAVVAASLALCNVCKLNDDELPLVGRLLGLGTREEAVLSALLDRFPLRLIALTRGSRGSRLQTRRARSEHPGFAVRVADTVGAGDAFTAALVMGLLLGHGLDRINEQANRVAAFVCSRSGATPKLPRHLTALFRPEPPA